jgi:hypothetical protein
MIVQIRFEGAVGLVGFPLPASSVFVPDVPAKRRPFTALIALRWHRRTLLPRRTGAG